MSKKKFVKILKDSRPVIGTGTRKVVLYKRSFDSYTLSIKPFSLSNDIRLLHHWVNLEYAKEFWDMQGSFIQLYKHYDAFLNSGVGYSLMFYIEEDPVAFVDYYQAKEDELSTYYEYDENDYGIHLLMAPHLGKRIVNLTPNVMITTLSFLFSIGVERVVGEPDIRNNAANNLVRKVGFRFMKEIKMSYKTANLYCYNKEDFVLKHGLK